MSYSTRATEYNKSYIKMFFVMSILMSVYNFIATLIVSYLTVMSSGLKLAYVAYTHI